MMLNSRFFRVTFLIVWILTVGGYTVFQVYDAHGHGWNPIQSTSTSTSVTTLRIDGYFTTTNTCGTCYNGSITTVVTQKTVSVATTEWHYHWWVLQYTHTSTRTEQRVNFSDGDCSNSSCPTNN